MPDGSRAAALSGTFSDMKLIRSRSVCQIVVEIPIERADAALSILGGVPKPGAEVHVALARLREAPPPAKERVPDAGKSFRAKQAYAESDEGRQAVTRAVLLCKEPAFQAWIIGRFGAPDWMPGDSNDLIAAMALRDRLGISSRSHIATDPKALAAFLKLEREYRDFVQFGEMTDGR